MKNPEVIVVDYWNPEEADSLVYVDKTEMTYSPYAVGVIAQNVIAIGGHVKTSKSVCGELFYVHLSKGNFEPLV